MIWAIGKSEPWYLSCINLNYVKDTGNVNSWDKGNQKYYDKLLDWVYNKFTKV